MGKCDALKGLPGAFVAPSRTRVPVLDQLTSIAYDVGMSKRRSKKMTDQIRQAIDDSGLTRYRIAQDTGIDESTLGKFYNGQRGLSMKALNALGKCLQLTINLGRKPDKKGK